MNEDYTLERLFSEFPGGICVPRIQRGYVQGRDDAKGMEIQTNFVPALVNATFDGDGLSLDFVYGVASGDGGAERRLLPLDGQQRLSTLFLLAWLCGKWKTEWRFDYEARRIPQLFVEGLRRHAFSGLTEPSQEIRDSAWFLPVWENDPTVAGMLRVLDALHKTLGHRNRADADFGRVTFLLHGIEGQSNTFDHIFRKMNARGKELSPWENMKSMLDKYLDKHLSKEMAEVWRDRIDGDWAECIWEGVDGDIVKLDNALEKTVRMAYARVAGLDAQAATLWQMDGTLSTEGEKSFMKEQISDFFLFATAFFNGFERVAGCWTTDRTENALWDATADESDFWKWLSNGQVASSSELLRIIFLVEEAHCDDESRRRRILLNLLDASSITTEDKYVDALSAGLGFLAGKLDLVELKAGKAGYSLDQLQDEERKWQIDGKTIVSFEKDELVCYGSLCFIGWSPFQDAADIRERLESIRSAIAGDHWLEFYQNLVSRIPSTKFDGRYAYIPLRANDVGIWGKYILTDGRFIDALKAYHDALAIQPRIPPWMNHLADLIRAGKVRKPALRCWDGWMFLLQHDQRRKADSIRLDWNENERSNRNLLRFEQVFYATPWPWAEAKHEGVWYNVCDPSWWESVNPPKGVRGCDGNIHFETLLPKANGEDKLP